MAVELKPGREHPLYTAYKAKWQKCIDAVEGQEAIHTAGTKYLPKLDEQSDDNYSSYKMRARFFNATQLTLKGYIGLVARKPAIISGKEPMMEFFDSVNLSLTHADEYMLHVLEKTIATGRCATLVDYTSEDDNLNISQATAKGARHIWAFYEASSIINWRYRNGKLVYVSLIETVLSETDDKIKKRCRVLIINDFGVYQQKIYDYDENTKDYEPVPTTITPKQADKTFDYIPIVFHTNTLNGDIVDNPPILDLVNVNLSHYQVKADHMHILHYLALPTPYIAGIDPNDKGVPTTIGPQRIWAFSDEKTKVGFLEMNGSGVASISEELGTIEEQLAQSGARIIQPNTEKTATASNLSSMSETSILGTLVSKINADIERVVSITMEWMGIQDEEARLSLNADFMPVFIDPNMLLAYVSAWQQGAISQSDLFKKLQQSEVLDSKKTFEQHQKELTGEGGGIYGGDNPDPDPDPNADPDPEPDPDPDPEPE